MMKPPFPSRPLPTSAADLFCDLLLRPNLASNPDLERSLSRILTASPSPLRPSTVDSVLRRCSPSADRLLLLRFFVWSGLQSPYRHSSSSYSSASALLSLSQYPNSIHLLLDRYRDLTGSVSASIGTFRILFHLCHHGDLQGEALPILRRMKEFNCRPDTACYNAVVRSIADQDSEFVLGLINEMALGGVLPDIVTYVSMVKGLCYAGRFGDARDLVVKMKVHGCEPNAVVYTALLDGACGCGDLDAAGELLGEMESGGWDRCEPNVVSYTCFLKCLCEKGRMEEAVGVLDRMKRNGCRANRVTVSTLLKALCRAGRVDDAYGLVERVVLERVLSSEECYNVLVVCLLSGDGLDEAGKLVRKMMESGMVVDGLTCNCMVRYSCSRGIFMEGFRWLVLFLKGEVKMDLDVYSVLVKGLCESRNFAEALLVIRLARKRGLQVDFVDVHALSELLNENGSTDLAV